MRQYSPAIGFLALCIVLITAIWIPLTHSSVSPLGSSSTSGESSAIGNALVEPLPIDEEPPWKVQLRLTAELDRLFSELEYPWPMAGRTAVPAVEVTALPIDLKRAETRTKKGVFLRTLLPLILYERNRVRQQRQRLLQWLERDEPPTADVLAIARYYRVKGNLNLAENREKLLRRVDLVPTGLALAQAAIESGWGTSRFAVNANNLFGVWTYKRSAGLAPKEADSDSRHAVRAYPSLRRAVRSYFFNINVGHAYVEFRRLREEMRATDQPLDAMALAAGLVNYSSRGEAYVNEVRQMIRANKLNQLGELTIASIGSTPTQ